MRLGCRGHDFGRSRLEELAGKVAGAGFESVQLALSKALSDAPAAGALDAAYARRAAAAFAGRGVSIAVLGCYINPIHPDPAERAAGIARFKELLGLARDFGPDASAPVPAFPPPERPLAFPVVGTETGSRNADCSFHPGNSSDEAFELLVEALRELAAAAEAAGALACVEGVVRHVASSPARLRAALDAAGSPRLGVILDPVNFLDETNWEARERIFDEAFELLGDRILVLHTKDFRIRGGALELCPPGKGLLDYPRLMRRLRAARPGADILIEDLATADMAAAALHLRRAWEGA